MFLPSESQRELLETSAAMSERPSVTVFPEATFKEGSWSVTTDHAVQARPGRRNSKQNPCWLVGRQHTTPQ